MKDFDVQAVGLEIPPERAFAFIADPAQLPRWTNAFASVANGKAVMRTPNGEVEVTLAVQASEAQGTVDWSMGFPDGSTATAFSRTVALGPKRCIFSFVLTPPPVALEQLEGALEAQSRILAQELRNLKQILENHE